MARMRDIDFARIELLVLDVDGVMTDGRVILSSTGDEIKAFHVRDGSGMKYWKRVGKKLAIITGRGSQAVANRAQELSVDALRMHAKDKLPALREIWAELDCTAEQTAVIGDDLTDLPLLLRCAFPVAVPDAAAEAREAAAYVTQRPGGGGCVREVVEVILKKAGLWQEILARYKAADEVADS